MDVLTLAAQIVGAVGTVLSLVYLHRKNMKNILITKMLIDIVWGLHYAMLFAYTGLVANLICVLREITFLRNKGKPKNYQLFIFMGLNCINSWFTWNSVYTILPAMAGILATYSFWQKNVTRTRWIALVNNILFFTYNACVGSFAGMLCETLTFISVLVAMIKNNKLTRRS